MTGRSERSARSALGFAGRRLVVVAVAVVVGALIALALAERQPARYAASAEVAVNQQAGLGSAGAGANSAQGLQRQIETLASVAHSPLVAAPAAATLHDAGWDGSRLLDHSTVEPSANADVLVFHVDAPSRALAGALATAYAKAFTDYRNGQVDNAYRARIADLDDRISQAQQAISDDTHGGGQPTPVHRQQLTSLLNQKADLEEQHQGAGQPVTVLRPGDDAHQTAPRPFRGALLGALLGLVFGLVVAFLLDLSDRRVSRAEDVAEVLPLPLLARVGRSPKAYARHNGVISLNDPHHQQSESYRMARASLELAMLRSSVRSIAVASAVPGEGKTTLAANLAVGFAAAGRSVALVDLDLRRPAAAAMFGLNLSAPGIVEVLRDRVAVSACLQPVSLAAAPPGGELDVLAARSDQAALPLLTRPALELLLADLAESHDMVLFDTPPLLAVSEPAIIASCADALVVTVRAGVTRQPQLAELAGLLSRLDVPVLGYVLTGVSHAGSYGYGYAAPVPAGNGNGHQPLPAPDRGERPLVPADLDA